MSASGKRFKSVVITFTFICKQKNFRKLGCTEGQGRDDGKEHTALILQFYVFVHPFSVLKHEPASPDAKSANMPKLSSHLSKTVAG